jgi:hypothetical protein
MNVSIARGKRLKLFVRLLTERSGLRVAALMGETEVRSGVFVPTQSLAVSPQT